MSVEETTLGAQEVQRVWRRRHLGLRKYNECGRDDTWGSGSTMSGAETILGAQEYEDCGVCILLLELPGMCC